MIILVIFSLLRYFPDKSILRKKGLFFFWLTVQRDIVYQSEEGVTAGRSGMVAGTGGWSCTCAPRKRSRAGLLP